MRYGERVASAVLVHAVVASTPQRGALVRYTYVVTPSSLQAWRAPGMGARATRMGARARRRSAGAVAGTEQSVRRRVLHVPSCRRRAGGSARARHGPHRVGPSAKTCAATARVRKDCEGMYQARLLDRLCALALVCAKWGGLSL